MCVLQAFNCIMLEGWTLILGNRRAENTWSKHWQTANKSDHVTMSTLRVLTYAVPTYDRIVSVDCLQASTRLLAAHQHRPRCLSMCVRRPKLLKYYIRVAKPAVPCHKQEMIFSDTAVPHTGSSRATAFVSFSAANRNDRRSRSNAVSHLWKIKKKARRSARSSTGFDHHRLESKARCSRL